MMKPPHSPPPGADTFPRLPGWITAASAQAPEEVAFSAGAALAHLDLLARVEHLPTALWRGRLALAAAEACAATPCLTAEKIALYLAEDGSPVARAPAVLEAVLSDAPRAETVAPILADAALARAAGWAHLLPLRPTDDPARRDTAGHSGSDVRN